MTTTDEEVFKQMQGLSRHKNILESQETRRLEDRVLSWEDFEEKVEDKQGNVYSMHHLDFDDEDKVEQTAGLYRQGFPELFGGPYQDLLFPSRYSGINEQMKIFVLEKDESVIAAMAVTPSEQNMSVEYSAGVTHPDFRRRGLGRKFRIIIDQLIEQSGCEFSVNYCATFHTATQRIFEGLSFTRVGVIPGLMLANVGDGEYARDSAMMYVKLYGHADNLCPTEVREV